MLATLHYATLRYAAGTKGDLLKRDAGARARVKIPQPPSSSQSVLHVAQRCGVAVGCYVGALCFVLRASAFCAFRPSCASVFGHVRSSSIGKSQSSACCRHRHAAGMQAAQTPKHVLKFGRSIAKKRWQSPDARPSSHHHHFFDAAPTRAGATTIHPCPAQQPERRRWRTILSMTC